MPSHASHYYKKKISFYDKFFWADRFSSLPKKCNFPSPCFFLWRNLDDVEYVHQIRSYFALLQRQKWPQRWLRKRERDREGSNFLDSAYLHMIWTKCSHSKYISHTYSVNVSRNSLRSYYVSTTTWNLSRLILWSF